MSQRSNNKDPLSTMLSAIRLDVEISVNAQFCGRWLLGEKTGEKSFHLISHGESQLILRGAEPQILHAGDLVIFMQAVEHQLLPIETENAPKTVCSYRNGLLENATGVLCGEFYYENNQSENLMDSLPPVLVIKQSPQTKAWVEPLISLILLENKHYDLGSDLILKQFTESLIINAIRTYINQGDFEIGILKLMADKKLSKALQAIQNEPQTHWTLEKLAQLCAMSRTAFATQFKQVSGWTAMEYLHWWRMQKAYSMLKVGKTMIDVSESVGYRSESAFSKAFKKHFDLNPGEVREK